MKKIAADFLLKFYELSLKITTNHDHRGFSMSYRTSHTRPNYGEGYQKAFEKNGVRKLYWEIEKQVIKKIYESRFKGNDVIRSLDFACGTGRVTGLLNNFNKVEVVGVDISFEMLRVAKERYPEVKFVEADLTNSITGESQLCDRNFDVVTAFRFFPNAEASLRYEAIKAIVKRLKPGGILIANNHRNPHSLYRRLTISLGGPQCSLTDEAFAKLAQDVGLQIRSRTPIGFLPLRERVGQFFFGPIVKLETIFSRIAPHPLLSQNVIYEFEKK